MARIAAILLCGGRSQRMAGATDDKIQLQLKGRPAWEYSLEAFKKAGFFDFVVWVMRDKDQEQAIKDALTRLPDVPWEQYWVHGGQERQHSVFNGLSALPFPTDLVFIHDMARPCLRPDTLAELRDRAFSDGSAVLAHRVTDTIREASAGGEIPVREHTRTLDRSRLWAMETPQVFKVEIILPAYQQILRDDILITDDAAALEYRNHPITLVENPYPNPKLTRPGDIPYLESVLNK